MEMDIATAQVVVPHLPDLNDGTGDVMRKLLAQLTAGRR